VTPTPNDATPTPAVTPTLDEATATSAATPTSDGSTPVPTATPASGSCGDGHVDAGETCDGGDDAACPTVCTAVCACPAFYELPLDGWSRRQGDGTWTVETDGGVRVLRTQASTTPATGFGIAFPSSDDLGVAYPMLAVTLAADGDFVVEVAVQASTGPERVLAYGSGGGVAIMRRRRVSVPLHLAVTDGRQHTFYRDLGADLQAAFGSTFVQVSQVRIYGNVGASHVLLAERDGSGRNVIRPESIVLPLDGWAMRGRGLAVAQSNDPAVDGQTLRVDPSAGSALATLPPAASDTLVAPFQTLSFLVRNEVGFSVELRIRSSDGRSRRLRFDDHVATPRTSNNSAILPLATPSAVPGSSFRLVTLDLSAGLAAMNPSLTMQGVLAIRMRGSFEIGDLVLQDPTD
jgi:hypothetical protein